MSRIIKAVQMNEESLQPRTIELRELEQEMDEQAELDELTGQEYNNEYVQLEKMSAELEQKSALAKQNAQQVITEAKEEAEHIRQLIAEEKEQAEVEIEEAKQRGYEQGMQEGFAQGKEEGVRSYEEHINQAIAIIAEAEREFERTIESAEPLIIELASALVKRMIGTTLSAEPEAWSSLLMQVISEVREHEDVKLYVHPNWYEHTVNQKSELEQLLSHTERLFIYPDANLDANGCVIESKHGRIDATIDRQLEELKRQLHDKLEEKANEST